MLSFDPTIPRRRRRSLEMAERISATPVRYPFSFVIAGDSGAWPDPAADAIYTQLLCQAARLRQSRRLRRPGASATGILTCSMRIR